jgi:hypothetical protein
MRNLLPNSASQEGIYGVEPIINLLLVQRLQQISTILCNDTKREEKMGESLHQIVHSTLMYGSISLT